MSPLLIDSKTAKTNIIYLLCIQLEVTNLRSSLSSLDFPIVLSVGQSHKCCQKSRENRNYQLKSIVKFKLNEIVKPSAPLIKRFE